MTNKELFEDFYGTQEVMKKRWIDANCKVPRTDKQLQNITGISYVGIGNWNKGKTTSWPLYCKLDAYCKEVEKIK